MLKLTHPLEAELKGDTLMAKRPKFPSPSHPNTETGVRMWLKTEEF